MKKVSCFIFTQFYLVKINEMDFNFQPRYFFPILCCYQTSDHPQEDLITIGYRPNMKIESFKNLLYVLTSYFSC